MNKIAFKVKKAAEKSIKQGHPWVYEASIVKQSKEGKAGDIAVIFDQRRNRLLAIGLYDPSSIIRIRILKVGAPAEIDRAFFRDRLEEALSKRKSLLATATTAFRLVYGENDALPGLIIDIYNKNAVIKLYSEVWYNFLADLSEIITELLAIETIVLRLNRLLQKKALSYGDGDILLGKLADEEIVFTEHGLLFCANLLKGHKTGYFLDHRHNRLRVRGLSKNKSVLDIFSYAGGFSVNAIAGGATEVISIDISQQALEIAKKNVALNFELASHTIMAIDAFLGIGQLRRQKKKFDLVIVDPPSFAKSEDQVLGAVKTYRRLVKTVHHLISKGGILLMASCSSRIDKETFYSLVTDELARCKRAFRILDSNTHDVDHPEGIRELSYLKSIYLVLE